MTASQIIDKLANMVDRRHGVRVVRYPVYGHDGVTQVAEKTVITVTIVESPQKIQEVLLGAQQ